MGPSSIFFRGGCYLIALFVLGGSAELSATEQLSLEDAVGLALQVDPALAISRYNTDVAEARSAIAKGRLLPKVRAFGQWSENEIEYRGGLPAEANRDYPGERYGVSLEQSIFNLEDWKERSRFLLLEEASRLDSKVEERSLYRRVVARYLDVLLSEFDLDQVKTEREAVTRRRAEAEALYENSFVSLTELMEVRAREDMVNGEVIAARAAMQQAREYLFALIGERNFNLMAVSLSESLPNNMANVEEATESAAMNNPGLKSAEKRIEAARKRVESAGASRWPELTLSFSSQYSDVGFDNLVSPPRDTETLQLTLNVPLYEGGAGMARQREAWAEYYVAVTERNALRRELDGAVRTLWLQVNANRQLVAAAKAASESAELSLAAAQRSADLGTGKFSDVLLALSRVSEANRAEKSAEYSLITAWLDLHLTVGEEPAGLALEIQRVAQ